MRIPCLVIVLLLAFSSWSSGQLNKGDLTATADQGRTGDLVETSGDPVYLRNDNFQSGAEPPAPCPDCGLAAGTLGCDASGCP